MKAIAKKTLDTVLGGLLSLQLLLGTPSFVSKANAQQDCESGSISLNLSNAPTPSAFNLQSSARVYELKGPFSGSLNDPASLVGLDTNRWGFADSSRGDRNTSNNVSAPSVVDLVFALPQGCTYNNANFGFSTSATGNGMIFPVTFTQSSGISSLVGYQESLAERAQANAANPVRVLFNGSMAFLPVFNLPGNYSTQLSGDNVLPLLNNEPGMLVRIGSVDSSFALGNAILSWSGATPAAVPSEYPSIQLFISGSIFNMRGGIANLDFTAASGTNPIDVFAELVTPSGTLYSTDLSNFSTVRRPILDDFVLPFDVNERQRLAQILFGSFPFNEEGSYRLSALSFDNNGNLVSSSSVSFSLEDAGVPSGDYPREIVAEIPVRGLGSGLAVSNDGTRLYAAGRNNVTEFDINLESIIREIPLPASPNDLVLIGNNLYVSSGVSGWIKKINRNTGSIEDTISADSPRNLTVSDDGSRIYFNSFNHSKIGELDLAIGRISYIPTREKPWKVVLANGKGYVSHDETSKITVFNQSSKQVIGEISIPSRGARGGVRNQLNNNVYFVSSGTEEVHDINTDNDTYTASIGLGGLAINISYSSTGHLLVPNRTLQGVNVVSARTNDLIDTVLLNTIPNAVLELNGNAYVTTTSGISILQ